MRLLVTGLSGFTGKHLAPMACQAGWEVVGLACDVTDPQAVQKAIERQPLDAVIHLAGISFTAHPDLAQTYRVNAVGTTVLLQALARASKQPTKVVLASSASVYGNSNVMPIVETQPLAPVNHYGASKLAMECLAQTYQDLLPIVIARPFNYTGPGQNPQFLVPKLVDHFMNRSPSIALGNLNIRREINDVRMVCQAYLRLVEIGKPAQTYNICSGNSHGINELLDALEALTGHRPDIQFDATLVRHDEVIELRGDPTRLAVAIGQLPHYSLTDTLEWMLSGASHG